MSDVIVIGAGTAGLACASELALRGARVTVIEKSDRVGGTLHVTAGQMSGAGTRLQKSRGIIDTPELHFADAMRIAKNTADPALVRRAVELGGGTIDWLMDEGFDMDPACPGILHFHEAYRLPRTYWGRDGGRSILAVLTRVFDRARATGRIELRLDTTLVGLDGEPGAVMGATVVGPRGEQRLRGAVVIATGGYGADRARFARWTGGRELFTACMPTSTGDGIALAEAFGAIVEGGDRFIPTYAGIEAASGGGRVSWDELPQLTPQARPPWEVHVRRDGSRFVAEDVPSVDARENALMAGRDLTFWIVGDSRAPLATLLPGWPAAKIEQAFASHPSFARAQAIDELARRAGIDPDGLARTVAGYNAAIPGVDPLGRAHRPAPIAAAPYFAIKAHGMVLKTPAGIRIDDRMRVLGADGPIRDLYAIGEAIGGGRLSGKSFVGGMSVTPALGFGRYLARALTGG